MSTYSFSTAHVDYLQRSGPRPAPLCSIKMVTAAPVDHRRVQRVLSVGRIEREPEAGRDRTRTLPSEDVLVGLHGYKIPISFLIRGERSGVRINVGTWSPVPVESTPANVLDARQHILESLLQSLFPAIEFQASNEILDDTLSVAGYVLGVPTLKPPETFDGALPLDRLIRTMAGCMWALLVLAEPVDDGYLSELHHSVVNEIRTVQTTSQAGEAPSPLADYYTKLLNTQMLSLSQAQAIGAWRTSVYLLGDRISYYRLAAAWRAIFSGAHSLPEPVRVWDDEGAVLLARGWAMPDSTMPRGPGLFHHPFQHQTLLTSAQLASYVHLPRFETSGYAVTDVPLFDVVPSSVREPTVELGNVVERTRISENSYSISRDILKRHALIAGVTGSGKTNTILHLLSQLWGMGIPFLVLEPAKTEYRALYAHEKIGPELQVFTLGDENVSPFRLNPFEVEEGVPISTHIDLLKSVFNASFGMWTPLPQILERGIQAVYRACGWDPVRGENLRLDSNPSERAAAESFPTLSELCDKVDEIIDTLGYESRLIGDLKAALGTRLNSMRIGGKGIMLDTRRSIPISMLLSKPTVIELEQIGDDDEKAFLMGVLLIRIYEHLRVSGSQENIPLRHVVVVEEAHRLLANVSPRGGEEQADMKGKAVETFVNMLAEVRGYGEGFLVADQIPLKLAPDIIKNTNLKIIHRTVAGDDRTVLAQSMNMEPPQCATLATLPALQAAVFAEGDDRPVLVQFPFRKLPPAPGAEKKAASDRIVAEHMRSVRERSAILPLFVPFTVCPESCGTPYRHCDEARRMLKSRDVRERVAAFVLALAAEAPLMHAFRRLEAYLRPRWQSGCTPESVSCLLLRGLDWYLEYFGRSDSWPYARVVEMRDQLAPPLVKLPRLSTSDDFAAIAPAITAFRTVHRNLCRQNMNAFAACPRICTDGSCLYRYHVVLLAADPRLVGLFQAALTSAATAPEWGDWRALDEVAGRMGGDLNLQQRRSISLCFGLQQVDQISGLLDEAKRRAVLKMIHDYDQRPVDLSLGGEIHER
jgi:DNA helicase HerA-like ATPase